MLRLLEDFSRINFMYELALLLAQEQGTVMGQIALMATANDLAYEIAMRHDHICALAEMN